MFRRLNVTAFVGTRSYSVNVITSGTRIRNVTDCTNSSSSCGISFDQSAQVYCWKSAGSTIRARSEATSVSERATVATPTGCQFRFRTSVCRLNIATTIFSFSIGCSNGIEPGHRPLGGRFGFTGRHAETTTPRTPNWEAQFSLRLREQRTGF